MSENKPTLVELLGSGRFQVARQDIDNPNKKQEDIVLDEKDSDEDENTRAKSLVDDVIEETESE